MSKRCFLFVTFGFLCRLLCFLLLCLLFLLCLIYFPLFYIRYRVYLIAHSVHSPLVYCERLRVGQYSLSLFDMMIYTSSTNTFWYSIQTNTATYLFRYHNYSTFPFNHQILSLIKYTANVDIALYYPLSMYNYSRVLDFTPIPLIFISFRF